MRRGAPGADEAVSHLMAVAFMEIRTMAGRRRTLSSPAPSDSDDFTRHIRALADACTHMPLLMSERNPRKRRKRAAEVLESLWVLASPEVLEWTRHHLGRIGYDCAYMDPIRAEAHARLRAAGHID